MPVCGTKLSMCCMILSVWGIIQLSLMGIFFYIHSVAFVEDVAADWPEDGKIEDIEKFYADVDEAYTQQAYNCWISAVLYVVVLAISAHQFRANARI